MSTPKRTRGPTILFVVPRVGSPYIPEINHRPKTLYLCCCAYRPKPLWCGQGQHSLYRSRQCWREVWREACTNYRGPAVRKGAQGPDYVACVFVCLGIIIICRLYKLTISNQTQITLQLRVSLSKVVQRCFVGPSLLGGPPPPPLLFAGSQTRCRRFRP